MEFFLRFLQLLIKVLYLIVHPLLNWLLPRDKNAKTLPPIENQLLTLTLVEAVNKIRERKLSSIDLVTAYVARIKEVNPLINAVIQERFDAAIEEAKLADLTISTLNKEQLQAQFNSCPLLGIPFTVKEACGLKGMSFAVGSLQRVGINSLDDGEVVRLLRAAGGIPLLVSANPEYCFSIETNTYTNGKCVNPYDFCRTAGGSSGGEGALNGAGASLFGVGSDIAGSIRLPSLFCGVFGHKPTGGLTSVKGAFPNSSDPIYGNYLQIGPITRFASDLSFITRIMAGKKAHQLDLSTPIDIKDIKIYYSLGFKGLNGLFHHSVIKDTQLAIKKAVQHFSATAMQVEEAHIPGFQNSTEIAYSGIARLQDFPFLINSSDPYKIVENLMEYIKSLFGQTNYTKDGLLFELLRRTNAFMTREALQTYLFKTTDLKDQIINLLGSNGVLLFPTFPVPAIHHNSSVLPLWAIDYTLIFNILGLPATHVPMGFTADSMLPVGFQVVAAPYKDKLCFKIAEELELRYGGWEPPTPHNFKLEK